MTCIVDMASKKALKEFFTENPTGDIVLRDPSVFDPYFGSLREYLASKKDCVVTNHPKRSYFAKVELLDNGKVRVS